MAVGHVQLTRRGNSPAVSTTRWRTLWDATSPADGFFAATVQAQALTGLIDAAGLLRVRNATTGAVTDDYSFVGLVERLTLDEIAVTTGDLLEVQAQPVDTGASVIIEYANAVVLEESLITPGAAPMAFGYVALHSGPLVVGNDFDLSTQVIAGSLDLPGNNATVEVEWHTPDGSNPMGGVDVGGGWFRNYVRFVDGILPAVAYFDEPELVYNVAGTHQWRFVATNSLGEETSILYTREVTASDQVVISTHPTSTAVPEGNTAQFSAAATNATSYQWQRADPGSGVFMNVSGATSTTYTTPVLTVGNDDGAQYRMVATGLSGSATTNEATLTVTSVPVGEFSTSGGDILTPAGATWYGTGMNVSFNLLAGPFVFGGHQGGSPPCGGSFDTPASVTAGCTYQGGGPNGAGITNSKGTTPQIWDPAVDAFASMPHRYDELTGNWNQNILRPTLVAKGDPTPPTPQDIIDAALPAIQEAADYGLVVMPELHDITGDNAEPTANWHSTLSSFTGEFKDIVEVVDAIVSNFKTDGTATGPGSTNVKAGHVWFNPTNEPWGNALVGQSPPQAFFDTMTFWVKRIRLHHFAENVIVIDLAEWGQNLHGVALGEYDAWWASLATDPAGDLTRNVVLSWHAYGARNATGSFEGYTYATMDDDLAAVKAKGFPLIIGEYGQAPVGQVGNAGTDAHNRNAVEYLTTNAHGQALADKYNVCPIVWHATGDTSFFCLYRLTGAGAAAGLAEPVWKITAPTDPRLEPLGVNHWTISETINAKNGVVADTEAPFIPGEQTFNVPEDTPDASFIGTLATLDNTAVTFLEITAGNTGSAFDLATNGALYVNSQTGMAANGPNFTLTATARDATGNETSEVFYVNVTATHDTTGPAVLSPAGSVLVVNIDEADITDHTWLTDPGPQTIAIHYRNIGTTAVDVDLTAGYLPPAGGALASVSLQPGALMVAAAFGGTDPWTTTDPYMASVKVYDSGTPATGAVEIIGSGELTYNSGTTFNVPTVQDGDILLVAVSEAGVGDPGAATASIPAGALTEIYSDKPDAGDYRPRQTLLGRSLLIADGGDLCTVVPGLLAESTGWVVLRGLTGLPGSKVQASGSTDLGIDFPSISATAGELLVLQGSSQGAGASGDESTLNITVTPILTQLDNNRGNWLAIHLVETGGSIDPGQLLAVGGGDYDNWVATVTKAATS